MLTKVFNILECLGITVLILAVVGTLGSLFSLEPAAPLVLLATGFAVSGAARILEEATRGGAYNMYVGALIVLLSAVFPQPAVPAVLSVFPIIVGGAFLFFGFRELFTKSLRAAIQAFVIDGE